MASRGSRRDGRSSASFLLCFVVAFLLGGLCAYGLYPYIQSYISRHTPGPTDATAPPPARSEVSALGRLEPGGGVIAVYGPPGDHILQLRVKQGDTVAKDAVVAVLASQKDRQQERELAQIQLEEAEKQAKAVRQAADSQLAVIKLETENLKSSEAHDLKVQEARIRVLEAQVDQARKQVALLKSLTAGSVADQDVQQRRLALTTAEGELEAARAVLEKTRNTYQQSHALADAKRKSTEAEREQALRRLPLDSLKQSVTLAERRLERTNIRAPVGGTVLKVVGHEGDATGGQPILHLADTGRMVAVAEVDETDVGLLHKWLDRPGAVVGADVTSRALRAAGKEDGLKGRLTGKEQIAGMLARNSLFSLNPREELDRRVIEVRVELDAESAQRAAELVGLQVEVRFHQPP